MSSLPSVHAQNPTPAGSSGSFVHIEVNGSSHDWKYTLPGVAGVPGGVLTVSSPLSSTPSQHRVNQGFNGRSFQTAMNPAIAQARGPDGLVLVAPTEFDGGGGVTVAAVDFLDLRTGAPAVVGDLSIGNGAIPYDLLVAAGGQAVFVANITALGALQVTRVSWTTGAAPLVAGSYTATGAHSRYVSRMVIDPLSGNLIVPLANGIDVVNPNTMTNVVTVPVQGNFQVGTNIAVGLTRLGAQNMIVGLRAPTLSTGATGVGYSYLTFAGTPAGVGIPNSLQAGNNPFDPAPPAVSPGYAYSSGFHEIALSAGGTVATFLLTPPPYTVTPTTFAPGAVGQVATASGVPQNTATIVGGLRPIGNPEAARNGTGEPIAFYGQAVGNFALGFMGAGVGAPIGSAAVSVPLGGVGQLGGVPHWASDRPLCLPVPAGAAGSTFMAVSVTAAGVAAEHGTELHTATPNGLGITLGVPVRNPAPITPVTFVPGPRPQNIGPSSMASILLGNGPPFPLPIGMIGFSGTPPIGGAILNDQLVLGPPLAPPVVYEPDLPILSDSIANPVAAVFFAAEPPATGFYINARQPQASVVNTGGALSIITAIPGLTSPPTGPRLGKIKFEPGNFVYTAPGMIVTEIAAL